MLILRRKHNSKPRNHQHQNLYFIGGLRPPRGLQHKTKIISYQALYTSENKFFFFLVPGLSGTWTSWYLDFLVPVLSGTCTFWYLDFLVPGFSGAWTFWYLGFLVLGFSGTWTLWYFYRLMDIFWSRDSEARTSEQMLNKYKKLQVAKSDQDPRQNDPISSRGHTHTVTF